LKLNENEVNKLRLILVKRPSDELETMNMLIVEILAVRKKITISKEQEKKLTHWEKECYQSDMI